MFSLLGKDSEAIAYLFQQFFVAKIDKIRAPMMHGSAVTDDITPAITDHSVHETLNFFSELTDDDVSKLIKKSNPTSYVLDTVPTTVILANVDIPLPVFTNIINKSIGSGFTPSVFKAAIVKTL